MTKSHTFISVALLQSISDPEAESKATNPTCLTQEEAKKSKGRKQRVLDEDQDDDKEMEFTVYPS